MYSYYGSGADVADSIPAYGKYLDWKVRKTVGPCCYYNYTSS